jgi:predicted metal-dependent HD superfamily phosphohydrolase
MNETALPDQLHSSWMRLATGFGAHTAVAGKLFGTLVNAYSERTRHYHTLAHVAAMLRDLDRFRREDSDRVALEFAAWFHDVIYDTHRDDNEKRSADVAANTLRALMVPARVADRVVALVLATATHDAERSDADANLFLDVDLAILGSSEDEYARYRDAIRLEYSWVDPDRYNAGRAAVLGRFLEHDRIYHTPAIFQLLEARARHNIAFEVNELRARR